MGDWIYCDTVDQLATGFGALLEQVQELDRRNARLEQLLDRMQEQVSANPIIHLFEPGMRRQHSSRSGAAYAALTENTPTH